MNCKSFFYLLALTIVTFSSCKKDADTKGETGEQGIPGTPGISGSIILSGTGAPATTLGKDGDYYLDKSTSIFYGPKAGAAWNTSVNLKGENGSNGAQGPSGNTGASGSNGSTILNGTAAPALSVGNIGDYYINTATADFYGPKTSNSWGTSISLKGPKGDSNGGSSIKMQIYKSLQFQNITADPFSPDDYQWTGNYSVIPTNYVDYNENGLVMIYIRETNDPEAGWSPEINERSRLVRFTNKRNSIEVNGDFDGDSPADVALIANYRFDLKVVMIPINIANNMTANHIDTKNISAIETFLKLNK